MTRIIKLVSAIFLSVLLNVSCDYESGMNAYYDDTVYQSKIFLFDITDSSTTYVADGYDPIILTKSNRILYRNLGLWIYEIESGNIKKIAEEFWSRIYEYSITNDEKFIVYRDRNDIFQLNLNTFETTSLISSDQTVNSLPYVTYSNNEKNVIYSTSPKINNSEPNFNLDQIRVYNLNTKQISLIDTISTGEYSINTTGFYDNDEKLYIIFNTGYDYSIHKNSTSVFIYSNDNTHNKLQELKINRYSGSSKYWEFDNKLLFIEIDGLHYINLNSSNLESCYTYDSEINVESMRKLKNDNFIVGSDTNNVVSILSLEGITINKHNVAAKGYTTWIDYSNNLKKIVVSVEVEIQD